MEIGMIIGSSVAVVILGGVYMLFNKTKDRKEPLTIWQDGDRVRLLLSDDEYCDFSISDIKDNQKRVDEELVKVVKARAKELVKFVDRVSFFDNTNEKFTD